MPVDLQRVNVKFYLRDEAALTPEDAFRVFGQWIPEATDEVLIDVADYAHVRQGPLAVLVGYEANYTLHNGDGRLGLVYGRKTPEEGSTAQRLRRAFLGALRACRRLEEHPDLAGKVAFQGQEVVLIVNDRLHSPNTEETLADLRPELDAFLDELYPGATPRIERTGNDRQRFCLRIRVEGDLGAGTLLTNLDGG